MSHFVFSSWPGWSHLRSLCLLAVKVACAKSITITILVSNVDAVYAKINAEIARCRQAEGVMKGIVRVATVGNNTYDPAQGLVSDIASFERAWSDLVAGSGVTCSSSGTTLLPAPPPSLLLLDGFQYTWLGVVRSAPSPPRVFQWAGEFTAGFLRISGPASLGGTGDILRSCAADISEADALALTEGAVGGSGTVVHVPGMPGMYEWEYMPQDIACVGEPFEISVQVLQSKFLDAADGLVTRRALAVDGDTMLTALSSWVNEKRNRPTFHLGPLMPFEPASCEFSQASLKAEMDAAPGDTGEQTLKFLDNALTKFGQYSVVYISFGTVAWPTNSEHVWLLLRSLEQQGIPFIFSHSSYLAQIPENLKSHYEESAIGLLSSWTPQQTILAHKACGWFLAHGGANGATEALSQGVPMIGWPFFSDQPVNITHMAYNLDVAFELFEVRTGERGLQKIYRTGQTPIGTLEAFQKELEGVLKDMKGEVGKRKRVNAQRIQQELSDAWQEGGAAKASFDRFLEEVC